MRIRGGRRGKEGKGDGRNQGERRWCGRFQMLDSLIGNTIIYLILRPVLQKPIFASLQRTPNNASLFYSPHLPSAIETDQSHAHKFLLLSNYCSLWIHRVNPLDSSFVLPKFTHPSNQAKPSQNDRSRQIQSCIQQEHSSLIEYA
jgi:hypothetical protein